MAACYGGFLRSRDFVYRDRLRGRWKKLSEIEREDKRYSRSRTTLATHDKFNNMREIMRMLFPLADYYSVLFGYPRHDFERRGRGYSPLIWNLIAHDFLYMVLHTLSLPEIDGIADILYRRHKQESRPKHWSPVPTLNDLTVRERIKTIGKGSKLKGIRAHLITLYDEFERQVDGILEGSKVQVMSLQPDAKRYARIVGKIPKDYKSQAFEEKSSFSRVHFWDLINRIVVAINSSLSNGEERNQAKRMVLQLPYYTGSEPSEILGSNVFPCNFPHYYLRVLAHNVEGFRGRSIEEFESYMKDFWTSIEAEEGEMDVFHRLRRLPGSFESGKRG